MMKIKGIAALLLLAPVLSVNAHPGHAALDFDHAHAPFGLDPIAALLWACTMVLAGFAGACVVRARRTRSAGLKRR